MKLYVKYFPTLRASRCGKDFILPVERGGGGRVGIEVGGTERLEGIFKITENYVYKLSKL